MKNNLTDSLYREIAGSGECRVVERVSTLLERQSKGQKLTKQEESVLAEAEKSLAGILGGSKGGYCPEATKVSAPAESPLPFSSFAEGIARLQTRINQRNERPQVKTTRSTGAYRPEAGGGVAVPVTSEKIAAIVKMARIEREAAGGRAKKPTVRKRKK